VRRASDEDPRFHDQRGRLWGRGTACLVEIAVVANARLATFELEGGPPEAIAFWKEAVADCEAELGKKPE
jgi:hypothetical protein